MWSCYFLQIQAAKNYTLNVLYDLSDGEVPVQA